MNNTEYFYDKVKVLKTFGILFILGVVAFIYLLTKSPINKGIYVLCVLMSFYIYFILRMIRSKNPVVTITTNELIVKTIPFLFEEKSIIFFNNIRYISTDINKGRKTLYIKTLDDLEYNFSISLLDASHEEIIIELKKKCKSLTDLGNFEFVNDPHQD